MFLPQGGTSRITLDPRSRAGRNLKGQLIQPLPHFTVKKTEEGRVSNLQASKVRFEPRFSASMTQWVHYKNNITEDNHNDKRDTPPKGTDTTDTHTHTDTTYTNF